MSAAAPDNQLLQLLGVERAELVPLESVQLRPREVLHEAGMPVRHAYFPVTAVISLFSTMQSGASAEVALVGNEGLVGLTGVLGTVDSATTAVVQIPGTALRMPAAALRAARLRCASVRTILDLYTEAQFIQVSQTAACNRLHPVEARLARWLLAIHDRIAGSEFTLPQELIAQMLGVHRPTVTIALQRLQGGGAIAHRSRAVIIADRARLEGYACECYGVLRRDFARVLSAATQASGEALAQAPREPSGEQAIAPEAMREIAGRLLLSSIREQEARERAEAADRSKDQFIAMVSHELRTPLNAILGWSRILLDRDEAPVRRGLEIIERNARAQTKLLEDLLDAIRMTSFTLTIEAARVSLLALVQQVVDTFTPDAGAKQVTMTLTAAGDPPFVRADADRLRQVLVNVIANALKFTASGGSVDVQVDTAADMGRVSVRDTGVGVPSDILPHVFERFRQGLPAEGGHRGLGLGLTIARVLVELHGGVIQLESPGEGRGTTCTIEIPVDPAHEPSALRAVGVRV